MPCGPVGFWRHRFPPLAATQAHLPSDLGNCWFGVGPRTREASLQVQAAGQASLPCTTDPADPTMPEVAVAERMLFGAFGVGESRRRPLGLWSKALPPCADNYSL